LSPYSGPHAAAGLSGPAGTRRIPLSAAAGGEFLGVAAPATEATVLVTLVARGAVRDEAGKS